jgi:hypothetical protein
MGDNSESALAYDVESGVYLERVNVSSDASGSRGALELVGRLTNTPPREGMAALFVVRSLESGRFRATRILAVPSGDAHAFYAQHAEVSLMTGPLLLRYFAEPVLLITSLAFPVGVFAYLFVPLWFAARRRRSAIRDAIESAPSVRSLVPADAGSFRRTAAAWISPHATVVATFAAGLAAAAPAVVALASLWGAR